jgi:hypothetical protein
MHELLLKEIKLLMKAEFLTPTQWGTDSYTVQQIMTSSEFLPKTCGPWPLLSQPHTQVPPQPVMQPQCCIPAVYCRHSHIPCKYRKLPKCSLHTYVNAREEGLQLNDRQSLNRSCVIHPFVLAWTENAGYRASFKSCTNLNIYTVRMVTLTTLGTGYETTLLINANSATHDADVLSQNKLVFGWTQYKAILHSWFFFWLVEWWICLRSLQ